MARCLGDLGWETSLIEDGGYRVSDFPQEQEDRLFADADECKASFGYDSPPPDFTVGQLIELYQHRLWEWKCVDDAGYSPSAPPSEQKFIDEYHSDGGTWSVYAQYSASMPKDNQAELFETCPRTT